MKRKYSRIFKFSDEINVVNVQDRNYTTITRSSSAPLGVGATIENDSIVCLSLEKIENDMSLMLKNMIIILELILEIEKFKMYIIQDQVEQVMDFLYYF